MSPNCWGGGTLAGEAALSLVVERESPVSSGSVNAALSGPSNLVSAPRCLSACSAASSSAARFARSHAAALRAAHSACEAMGRGTVGVRLE